MRSFERISDNKVLITVDNAVFNDTVITKALYWLSPLFIVYQEASNNNVTLITLEKADGDIAESEIDALKKRLNQDFIDFKTRDIIFKESKNVRDILYVKAFACNDDFEDYNLTNS